MSSILVLRQRLEGFAPAWKWGFQINRSRHGLNDIMRQFQVAHLRLESRGMP